MKRHLLNLFGILICTSVFAQQFTVNGNATQLSCECYQLTPNAPTQGGAAWNNNQISLANPFDFHFRVFLGCSNSPGADGICFILQNTNTGVSSSGGGLGYANFPNQSIGIELDTYQNSGFGDPAYDHVAMESNGNISHNLVAPVQASATSQDIEDCQWHDFHVVWDPVTQTMTVSFDGVQRFTYVFAGGLTNTIFLGNPNVYWGWTGATGAEYNVQQYCIDIDADFTGGTNNAYCSPSNVPFTSTSQSGLNSIVGYSWDFGDGSATSSSQNPTHTFPGVGTYNVTLTVTDQSLCTNVQSYPVTINNTPTLTPSHTDVSCNGGSNGSVTITAGGTPQPYTVSWAPAATNVSPNGPSIFTSNNLSAGNYNTTVTDANQCSVSAQITVSEPAVLTAQTSHTDVQCYGGNDGTLSITLGGGTAPYYYLGNPVPAGTTVIPSLTANTYAGNITDSHGCTAAISETISQPAAPLSQTAVTVNPSCYQGSDGTIDVTAAGGTAPYTNYVWSPSVSSSSSASGLSAGNYTVLITDSHMCTASSTYTLTDPAPMQLSETHIDEPCNGDASGSVTIQANGGTPNYSYAWNPNVSSAANATALSAGNYNVTVTDAGNCSMSISATVSQPAVLVLNAVGVDALCYGQSTGGINSSSVGGTPGYTYSITQDGSNFIYSATGVFTGIPAGTYTTLVADQNGCTKTVSVDVNEPTQLTDVLTTYEPTCYHYHNGVMVTGGGGATPPYTFSLSDGQVNTDGLFYNLSAGNYDLTVTDANGCTITDAGIVTEPDSVLVSVSPDPAEVKLAEELNLSATTNQGGTVTYEWTPSFGLSCYDCAEPVFDGVYSQTYTAIATNDSGCVGTAKVAVKVIPVYDVFFPNAFSPNGDGANDVWQIFGNTKAIKQLDVKVFNRWGELVFESNDVNFKWDPVQFPFKGKPLDVGVYAYEAKLVWMDNHSDSHYIGSLTVVK